MTPPQNDTTKPATNKQQATQTIQYHPPKMPGGGPPCVWDNGPTQRTGSCYTCILCGSTTSCG